MVIEMQYEIYFLANEFKDLIDDSLLNELINVNDDEFSRRQLRYFFLRIKKEEVYTLLTNLIGKREDVIIDDDLILYKNQVTGESSKLTYGEDGSFYLSSDNMNNPILMSLIKKYHVLVHKI